MSLFIKEMLIVDKLGEYSDLYLQEGYKLKINSLL